MKCVIRELIEERGFKRSYIANKLGITVKQLRNYETNHSFIPMDKAFLLADFLGVKVDDLYNRIEDTP